MEKQILISESYGEKYDKGNHSVGISMWHFEWCTKYRYKMFRKEEQRNLITACIRRAALLLKTPLRVFDPATILLQD
ncbi:MAG: hypothetical protein WDZ69_01715 [Candidatus Pacearchaeota archaeon]